jgi:DNA-binding CsgD family transcriptional regulator
MSDNRLWIFLTIVFSTTLCLLAALEFVVMVNDARLKVDWMYIEYLEIVEVVFALLGFFCGMVATVRFYRDNSRLHRRMGNVQKKFETLAADTFKEWQLTEAEGEIAMLLIKGFSIAEISSIREKSEGTVKNQCSAVYHKAGVSSKQQLVSSVLDVLIGQKS